MVKVVRNYGNATFCENFFRGIGRFVGEGSACHKIFPHQRSCLAAFCTILLISASNTA